MALAIASSLTFMRSFALFKPDVIVLDVLMPYIDSFEMLQWLLDVDYSGRLVAMSGHGRYSAMVVELASTKRRIGAAGLCKPFQIA